ncbi:MAG: HAMP domain-containing protein, partial [Planctomycetota bacterium]
MQHAGFFWKLWAACAAPGLICIVALSIAFLVAYRSHLDETLEEKLATTVDAADELLEVDWQGPPDASLQDEVRSLGTLTATRLTVIRADGQVLADSYRDDLDAVIAMENHGRRPEIIEAKRSGVAGISRASAEIGERFRYHAIRVDDGEVAVGYVRASIPEAARTILGNALNATLWTVGVLLAVVVILAAYLLASRLTAPIRSLTSAASAIAAGNYDQRLAPPSLALDEI